MSKKKAVTKKVKRTKVQKLQPAVGLYASGFLRASCVEDMFLFVEELVQSPYATSSLMTKNTEIHIDDSDVKCWSFHKTLKEAKAANKLIPVLKAEIAGWDSYILFDEKRLIFGCGDVDLTFAEAKEFINDFKGYQETKKKIDTFENKYISIFNNTNEFTAFKGRVLPKMDKLLALISKK